MAGGATECCRHIVCEGCPVLLVIDEKRRFIFRVERGRVQGSDRGTVRHDDLIGLRYGSRVRLSSGIYALVLQPRLVDYMERGLRRRSQVIYPKDHGLILMLLDIEPGNRVLEIGVGSGYTTIVLARAVGPEGKVYSYEIRRDMFETARRNLETVGLLDRVELKHRDARLGVDEENLDAAVVDMPDPWAVLPVLHRALRPGAGVVFFLPAVNQVARLLAALELHGGWAETRVYEVLLREYEPRSDALRPRTTMIAHTGYLVYTRRIERDMGQHQDTDKGG
ncbi:tRNA-methyltransferase [Pyrodictium delaneyi]|uniref:Protein methyltransferase n=1 Tax=Pyrodictium delaneyi TaxID=1273541 RepID=A0A0P0N4I6_9CREN|nr:tRNA (adenine-N1)-methyltransferase [Pyrodictium delaneyi]ALL01826.1 tRNA-methyltransferase [Pyrodictium delaneyi]OWJ54959.1 protein methyltransferase [Pyrodictium delaneyi]